MPELPEVEILKRYLEESALHQIISSVHFLDNHNKIYKSSRAEIEENLVNQQLTETARIGKYLFARISNGKWLHLHFGMSGSLELYNTPEPPKYTRFILEFEEGSKLAFRDLRKFGVIKIVDGSELFRKENKIGEDLLKIDESVFVKKLQNRKVAIKTALLDQKHFAGIGNWIADEMLFDCGIHPQEKCSNLSDEDLQNLHKAGVRIVKTAIEKDTHYGSFPEAFFVNYRKTGALHPDFPGSPVEKLTVGGRSTFYVPARQALNHEGALRRLLKIFNYA